MISKDKRGTIWDTVLNATECDPFHRENALYNRFYLCSYGKIFSQTGLERSTCAHADSERDRRREAEREAILPV